MDQPYEWIMTDKRVDWVLKMALGMQDDTPLPGRHVHPRFEEPMGLVFAKRYDG